MTDMESLDHLFADKAPELREVFDLLVERMRTFGPLRIAPKKTSIHLEKNSGLAGVHPRKEYFNLEFRTDYSIDHPRVKRTQQLSARRFEHTVKVTASSDIDEQLLSWLKDAYDLSK